MHPFKRIVLSLRFDSEYTLNFNYYFFYSNIQTALICQVLFNQWD